MARHNKLEYTEPMMTSNKWKVATASLFALTFSFVSFSRFEYLSVFNSTTPALSNVSVCVYVCSIVIGKKRQLTMLRVKIDGEEHKILSNTQLLLFHNRNCVWRSSEDAYRHLIGQLIDVLIVATWNCLIQIHLSPLDVHLTRRNQQMFTFYFKLKNTYDFYSERNVSEKRNGE